MDGYRNLIANIIQTPDGTILRSIYRHDYVAYLDKNGETYFTDGGSDYMRTSVNKEPFKILSVYDDEPYEKIREYYLRGTFTKDGESNRIFVPLSKLSDKHLQGVIDYNNNNCISPQSAANEYYIKEQEYRKIHNITIPEHDYVKACETVTSIMRNIEH